MSCETKLDPSEYHLGNIEALDRRVRAGWEYLMKAKWEDGNWELWDKLAARLQYLRECQFYAGDVPMPEFAPMGKWCVQVE